MAAQDATPSEIQMSTELALDDLRRELPGLEADRRLDDWGRSQRVQAGLDATVLRFLHDVWFRVELEGVGNVPRDGGALLLANHGTLGAEAVMVATAVRARHPDSRQVRIATEGRIWEVPGLGMMATKAGVVAAHPANLHRLLFDDGELVLVFGEQPSAGRRLLRQRYRLGPFSPELIACARRARAPIVPVAVLGGEEAASRLIRWRAPGALKALPGAHALARLEAGLALAGPLPLPAKLRIRVLEPVPASRSLDEPDADALAHQIRALLQENLLEMAAARRSVWLG